MSEIIYIERTTGQKQTEKVYQEWALRLLYGSSWLTTLLSPWLLVFISRCSWFSRWYGFMQKRPSSARKILPFIKKFHVDASEFLDPVSSFRSFNDFFIRKLKLAARPIDPDPHTAVIPADGRYYFYSNIADASGFIVKGQKFDLEKLLGHPLLADEFKDGSMVLARLCPSDYHRFHFPCECLPGPTELINGWLYSVNPIAIKKNIQIFTENKRTLCVLETPLFGRVLFLEIGATNVGSIRETYILNQRHSKGAEKGYFEFGGSALIVLFAKGAIEFDPDLLSATKEGFEIRCLMGQSMGRSSI